MSTQTLNINDAIERARQHHQAGRLQQAEQIYQQILQADPDHADANHLLGVLVYQVGKHEVAAQLISKAILKDGNKAQYYNNLGLALQAQGNLDQAAMVYRQAIAIDSDYADAYHNLGVVFQDQGSFEEALVCYDQAIRIKPDYAGAYNNRGVVLQALARLDEALAAYRKAIDIIPNFIDAHNNLGNVLTAQGRFDDALAAYRNVIGIDPNYAGAYNNLGHTLRTMGRYEEALAAFQRAIDISPGYADAHNNLGNTYLAQGKLDRALQAYDQALAINPDYAGALYNRGLILHTQGRLEEALASYDQSIDIKPDYADAHNNRGNVLEALGSVEQALEAYDQAIIINPNLADAHNNRGVVLHNLGRLEEALVSLQRAIAIEPDFTDAYNNCGNTLEAQGRIDEALAAYRQVISINPGFARAYSNLLLCMNYDAGTDAETLFAAHREWDQQYAASLADRAPVYSNTPDPERRLRIGYVSADYYQHPVASFIEPLLKTHERRSFEVVCYTNATRYDDVSERLQQHADKWRSIAGMSDEHAAGLITEDGIDILVDLSGHTAGNRMLMFAHRPAPVQVTYLGYPGSSGLSVMDYRLSDNWIDPPGMTERFHSEEIIRLPGGSVCFQPLAPSPGVVDLPDLAPGSVTFGSFNNTAKVTPGVVTLWSNVLQALPHARLLMKSKSLGDQQTIERLKGLFEQQGIAPDRLEFISWTASSEEHLALYNRVHIGLDTFPYSGCTTTCEALWMGVPVITLARDESRSRMSLSILKQAGMDDCIAESPEAFISLAEDLAIDIDKLRDLRFSLRQKINRSSLLNAKTFTQTLESAYRGMWERWCNKG